MSISDLKFESDVFSKNEIFAFTCCFKHAKLSSAKHKNVGVKDSRIHLCVTLKKGKPCRRAVRF